MPQNQVSYSFLSEPNYSLTKAGCLISFVILFFVKYEHYAWYNNYNLMCVS